MTSDRNPALAKGDDERVCALKHALAQALDALLATLGRYTLADLIAPARPPARMLNLPTSGRVQPLRASPSGDYRPMRFA